MKPPDIRLAYGARSFPLPGTFVKNVPKQEALAAAEAAYMPKGMVTMPFSPPLINTGSKLILIDLSPPRSDLVAIHPKADLLCSL